jgi:hypothetical protein
MAEVVLKSDVERMLKEAFQSGHADDPQLIPNLINSLNNFVPTFDVELNLDHYSKANSKVSENMRRFGLMA